MWRNGRRGRFKIYFCLRRVLVRVRSSAKHMLDMNITNDTKCPCSSGENYSNCCESFHKGALPSSAVQLMRSRYSAYAYDLPEYIIETTHPLNPGYRHEQVAWKKEISLFSRASSFKKLEILDSQEKDDTATVTFVAHISQNGGDASFTEKSLFKKIDGKWLYHSGQAVGIA
jgi:SEC-C motif domain protein